MKRLLCPRLPSPGKPVELSSDEARHALQVLRLRNGERIEAMDGKGSATIATLRLREGKTVWLEKSDSAQESQTPPLSIGQQVVPLTLEVAILKGDAMEWVIEKSVELGAKRISPLITAHGVVKIDRKGPEAFLNRWRKIADQSLKQCGRLTAIEIDPPRDLGTALAQTPATVQEPRFWCDEASREDAPLFLVQLQKQSSSIQRIRLLVGPEGGWSARERELLSKSAHTYAVSLGPLVLRAETASISALSLAQAWLLQSLTTARQ
jgi:16S rRNA (uracil1498-N3)-methyltransferase